MSRGAKVHEYHFGRKVIHLDEWDRSASFNSITSNNRAVERRAPFIDAIPKQKIGSMN